MTEAQLEKMKKCAVELSSCIEHCYASITVTIDRQGTPPGSSDPVCTVRINSRGDLIGVYKEVE
tara:strand:+ start:578 stop:769 length:192 start_codon:yes stop_codon:yes gene_type:complete